MITELPFSIDSTALSRFCQRNHIQWLALFGSHLAGQPQPDSDVDVLVTFEPDRIPGLIGLARMERELSVIFGDKKVDLRTPEDLSRFFRDEVLASAGTLYGKA